MTTDLLPAGDDPRRLLSDARALAHRVRLDRRVTWVALLVLAVVTFLAIPFEQYFLYTRCWPVDHGTMCHVWDRGAQFYWPPALLLAYAVIAVGYVRVARARGLGARVVPYALTGAALTILDTAAWLIAQLYLDSHPALTDPLPWWAFLLDHLAAPAGTIGLALLVLARLERSIALLAFTLGYLAVVLVPGNFGWPGHWGVHTQQVIDGTVLLLGAVGFALVRWWRR